ncbi:hypothetical protein B7755_004470 [Streptomyces sp. NBS 14/10]|uniref:hypothetical protein n=1 Tax=Streptomyces sp. NBS 14/10 TaxID=1945643 RepID=UPI000B7D15DB|nr:hypothetical protein [Streptomyces sp. NBS 14/10]KAK1177482.1 hypothetical protein B7755_004470 [Streptomyces sp. NBS 14/10]NUS83164.1 hypothetical protein [Streptomyces sp.]
MTNNGEVALAFTSGYLLGRGHRMRSALALAGVTAGRRLVSGRGLPGPVPGTSELGKLGHEVRDQLMAAGRSAAMSAASHRIDALSDRLEQRADALRHGSDGHEGAKETKAKEAKAAKETEETEETDKAKETRETGEARRKSTTDRPERPRKKAGAGGTERRSRG